MEDKFLVLHSDCDLTLLIIVVECQLCSFVCMKKKLEFVGWLFETESENILKYNGLSGSIVAFS
jgi:hypothetical protein